MNARLLASAWASLRSSRLRHAAWPRWLLAGAVLVLLVSTLEEPRTLLYFSGKSEIVALEVVDPLRATLVLERVRDEGSRRCLEALAVTPATGSRLQYVRRGARPVEIAMALQPGSIVREGDAARRLAEPLTLLLSAGPAVEACTMPGPVRLPAHGFLRIGQLAGVTAADAVEATPLLLQARLQVYGRAVSSLFGLPLVFAPFAPGSLYAVQELHLPGGSQVGPAWSGVADGPSRDRRAVWTGFVDAVSADDGQALDIEATSNTREVAVFLPSPPSGDGADADAPDVVSLTLGARLLGDPNLRWLYGLVTVIVLLFTLAQLVQQARASRPRPDDAGPAAGP